MVTNSTHNGAVTDWDEVLAHDFALPSGRPAGELAAELCGMLGSPDPEVRDDTAYPVLAVWTACTAPARR